MPAEGYWQKVQQFLKKNGIVFIIDDVRCGFRLHMGGSNELFGFKPDLICFCKAIANGYPISALVGTEALKNAAAKVFPYRELLVFGWAYGGGAGLPPGTEAD